MGVVLAEHGEGPVVRRAGGGADPAGYLPLDHHREGSKAGGLHQLFQNGRGDVIGQVGADYRREALELLCRDGREVQFQHVPRHDLHIRIGGHGLRQHRQQGPVQLHGGHLPGPLGQLRRQGADARADLQHAAACVRAGGLRDPAGHLRIDQKVLSHGFGEMEPMPGQQVPDGVVVTEIHT